MKTTAGLRIDHRKAVIAIVSAEREETLEIKSNVEKQPGSFAGVRSTTRYGACPYSGQARVLPFAGFSEGGDVHDPR